MFDAASPPPKIGPIQPTGRFALSPMADFTSWPLRLLCGRFGAAFSCTEMVKAKFVVQRNDETLRILERHADEAPCGGQICGGDHEELAAAARILVEDLGFPFVDLNIACPIRRVVAEGAGGGMLSDPPRVEAAVRALVKAVHPVPVTVKMRSGLDPDQITAVDVACAAQAGGASLIALHPRTVRQGYGGRADHGIVAAVKAAVQVPVVGGGDVNSPADALKMLRETKCDFVYFARAATGDPWIFSRAQAVLNGLPEPPQPSLPDIARVFGEHARRLVEHLGERDGCLHVRRLAREYRGRFIDAAQGEAFYQTLRTVERLDQVEAVLAELASS